MRLIALLLAAVVALPTVAWAAPNGQQGPLSEADIAAAISPSVVQIVTREGMGSGVQVSGGIVTNDHVVADAETVEYIDSHGQHHTGRVLKDNPTVDLALVDSDAGLPQVKLASAHDQRQGEQVLVLGYPLGIGGQATLSRGLISAIRDNELGQSFVQTDASVIPGNSGGAMVNMRGELIGIPTYGYSVSGSLSFAIASDTVRSFLDAPQRPPLPDSPAFVGDAQSIALTADELGPDWQDMPSARADELSTTGGQGSASMFVQGLDDSAEPNADSLLRAQRVLQMTVSIEPNPEAAERAMLRSNTTAHPTFGAYAQNLTRVEVPSVADTCRGYAYSQDLTRGTTQVPLHMMSVVCRSDNVLISGTEVTMTGETVPVEEVAFWIGKVAERERLAARGEPPS